MVHSFQISDEEAQRLNNLFASIGREYQEIQDILSSHMSSMPITQPSRPEVREQSVGLLGTPPVPDISRVQWRIKGGGDAEPDDEYAFAFATKPNGSPNTEVADIVAYLKSHGNKFETGGYTITLKDKFIGRAKKR
jgi:hypothetical protein